MAAQALSRRYIHEYGVGHDNVTSLCYLGKPAEGTALPKLFERASAEMSRTDYKVWGINIAMDPWPAPKEDVVAHDLPEETVGTVMEQLQRRLHHMVG